MASSSSYTYTVPGSTSSISLKIAWTSSQDIANNQTTVTATAYLVRGKYGRIGSSASKAWSLTIDGTTWSGNTTIGGSANSTKQIAKKSKTIKHNSDGTKSFSINYKQTLNIGWSGGTLGTYQTGNRTWALNTIPRASSLGTISNVNLGSKVSVGITSHASSFTHTLTAKNGSTTQKWTGLKGGTNSLTFNSTMTTALTNALKSASSTSISWTLTTDGINGSSSTKSSTVSLPSGELTPTAGTMTWVDVNASKLSSLKANTLMQGVSKLTFTVSGSSATHGASITKTQVTFNGETITASSGVAAMTKVLATSGTATATLKVTDSRGRTATSTLSITDIVAYGSPLVTIDELSRSDGSGNINSEGTSAYAMVSYSTASLSDAGVVNSAVITVTAATADDPDTVVVTGTSTQTTESGSKIKVLLNSTANAIAVDKAYTVTVTVTDKMGASSSVSDTISVAKSIMTWTEDSVGFGTVPTYKGSVAEFDNGDIYFGPNSRIVTTTIWTDIQDKYVNTDAFDCYDNNRNNDILLMQFGPMIFLNGTLKPKADIDSTTAVNMFVFQDADGNPIYKFRDGFKGLCQGSYRNIWLWTAYRDGTISFSRYGTTDIGTASTNVWLPVSIMVPLESF